MEAIAAEGLSKVYRTRVAGRTGVHALTDFSLTVESGQIFGLLGPNGAGKTTFVRTVLSLVRPTSGSARLLGVPLPDVNVRSRTGYLPEQHRYPPHMTGEAALRLFGRLSGATPAILNTRVPSLLAQLGLSEWGRTKIKRYSKGMVQRLGLAQAMLHDPDVLFLDEPTDGLDPVGRKEIRDVLIGLRNEGKTIFLNSHLLSEVELVCDRVAVLDRGKLLRVATVDELTVSGTRYEIGFAGQIPPGFLDETRARVLPVSFGNAVMEVDVHGTDDLNRLIDLMRSHRIAITSIIHRRASLEDSFLKMLKPGEGT